MSTHVTWALVGFGIALLFIWVYHMLKKRGFKFFWYHPLFTGLFLLFVLYLLERIFADLSDFEVQESWNMLTTPLEEQGTLLFFFSAQHLQFIRIMPR